MCNHFHIKHTERFIQREIIFDYVVLLLQLKMYNYFATQNVPNTIYSKIWNIVSENRHRLFQNLEQQYVQLL